MSILSTVVRQYHARAEGWEPCELKCTPQLQSDIVHYGRWQISGLSTCILYS